MSTDLYSVPWGEQRVLVPAELMPQFCALAKADGGDDMRYADYPRKLRAGEIGSERSTLEGLPTVPEEFRGLLPR